MENPEHKLIWSSSESRNLSNDTFDTGDILDDSLYNYFVEVNFSSIVATVGESIDILFNNSIAPNNNYRVYNMRGYGSVADARVYDGRSNVQLDFLRANDADNVAVLRFYISGESGRERYVDGIYGTNGSSGFSAVCKVSGYWKDEISKITSLQLRSGGTNQICDFDIRIYQIPKTVNLENYELITEQHYDNATIDIDVPVNGDDVTEYLVKWQGDNSLYIGFNDSLGDSDYVQQRLTNNAGTIGALKTDPSTSISVQGVNGECRLFTKSGSSRLAILGMSSTSSDPAYEQYEKATWWGDEISTVDKLVLRVISNTTGVASVYRRISNKAIDPVPMVTVAEIDVVNEDISAGYTITDINGDSIDGAIKVEWTGEGSTIQTILELTLNSITDYNFQSVQGSGNSAGAGFGTKTYLTMGVPSSSNPDQATLWIYPKSGQARPVLTEYTYTGIPTPTIRQFMYHTMNEEVAEVNSMEIVASNAGLVTGKIRISVPKQSAQKCGKFTVTKNT